MTISLAGCKQAQPTVNFPSVGNLNSFNPPPRGAKVVFIMGATGTGKSKLSIDLATRFPAEIINSDKMQVYKGINIATNKVTEEEMCGVTHHLLGVVDPNDDFSATDFRRLASNAVESILGRGRTLIIVGGSNLYIEALVDDDDFKFRFKYDCCFLWVDVSLHVLHSFMSRRVDQMVEARLVDKVRQMFDPAAAEYSRGITFNPPPRRAKVVFIMGATGTGKSKLSIDLATRFPAEIINSDKMQVYKGLSIATNKVTEEEMCGVTHHLLGVVDPDDDFSATDFRRLASNAMESILGRGRIPIIVGGSNSFIEALVDDDDFEFRSKYDCCFLWVDVSLHVLHSFVSRRVDQMVEAGLVDEVRQMVDPAAADYSRGIRRAIGVPEMDEYFRSEAINVEEETRVRLLEEAINKIKENTCNLACCQLKKIHRLRSMWGWNLHRLDATEVFQRHGGDAVDAWEMLVAGRSTMIVGQFLYDDNHSIITATGGPPVMGTAVAAATR